MAKKKKKKIDKEIEEWNKKVREIGRASCRERV